MSIIDGRLISSKLKEEYREKISKLEHKPFLAMIRIGDDPASEIYVRNKGKLCGELGIPFSDIHLKSEITQEELL